MHAQCSTQLSPVANALWKVMLITLTTSPVPFPPSNSASQELLLPCTEGSFLMCDFYWEPVNWRMILTPRPTSSHHLTAAWLSFFFFVCQTYCCHLPTAQGVMTLQTTKQTWTCLKPTKQSHSETPPKSHLMMVGIIGIPVSRFWDCPPHVQTVCNPHSWREKVERPRAGAGVFSQPPPRWALVSSLICSVVTWPLPSEPGLTARKPVTECFLPLWTKYFNKIWGWSIKPTSRNIVVLTVWVFTG